MTTIWLRAETKPQEARCALDPGHAKKLVEAGFEVFIERSSQRALADDAFQQAGCRMVAAGSWTQAPDDAYILGVKDLPQASFPLRHRHIYFGHAYKGQQGWQALLKRFADGGGQLFDIEYLVDETGRRVAAFGYWAGFTGCAVGVKNWIGQKLARSPVVPPLGPYSGRDALVAELQQELGTVTAGGARKPRVIIIGAKGRVGTGAGDLADALGLDATRWDIEETAGGGPFKEILSHDIFVNCVLVTSRIPPFVRADMLRDPHRVLSVISDVSCDPGENNPIPIYDRPTTFSDPVINILPGPPPLDVTAIDHLPSLLPVEASADFGGQLLPYLLKLDNGISGVWERALQTFHDKIRELQRHQSGND